jgi:hypothetical protein
MAQAPTMVQLPVAEITPPPEHARLGQLAPTVANLDAMPGYASPPPAAPAVSRPASVPSASPVPPKRSGSKAAVYIVTASLAGALLLLGAAGGVWLLDKGVAHKWREIIASRMGRAPTTASPVKAPPKAVAPASSVTVPARPAPGCTLRVPAKRLWGSVQRRVPPALGATSNGVGIAFASDESTAIGLVVDPTTLSAQDKQPQLGKPVLSTVVLGSGEFVVVRDDFPIKSATAVPAGTPFVVGQIERHFARAKLEKPRPELEWKGVGTITPPSVASLGVAGYAVAFRSGGAQGKVLFGRLDESGKAKAPLDTVAREDAQVGTPTIAAGPTGALIAFATRPDEKALWSLALARVAPNEAPAAAARFEVPPGGPAGHAMSPAVAAFDDGRWLVQWTEGQTGAYRVRARSYAGDLTPIGDAVTISPEGMNAGQGAAFVTRKGVVVVFVGAGETTDELWAASLHCEPGD